METGFDRHCRSTLAPNSGYSRGLRMMTTLLLTALENAAAQIAGYGVKLVFVAQTLAQLKDTYKKSWEMLLANAGVKMLLDAKSPTTTLRAQYADANSASYRVLR